VLGRAARNEVSIKIRQPLPRLFVAGVSAAARRGLEAWTDLVLAELNVKELVWAEVGDLAIMHATPVFPSLGPKHGKDVNQVAEAIRSLPEKKVASLAAGRKIRVTVGDKVATVEPADVEIESRPREGLSVQTEGTLTVALDTTLTDELRDEGFAREMINKIQFMRKAADFDVVDRIRVTYEAGPRLKAALKRHASWVAKETLAESLAEGKGTGELEKEWDLNGEWARIAVERVERT
jgi:isoleucyl-tRNA synthetase